MTDLTSAQTTIRVKEYRRFLLFLIVGLSGTLLDFGILAGLKQFFEAPTLFANTVSYSAGIVNNFTLNRLWTFPDSRSKKAMTQLGQFALISSLGMLLNNAVVLLLEAPFGTLLNDPGSGYLPAKLAATGAVVFWNYFANRHWTFDDVR